MGGRSSYNSTECGDGLFGPSVWVEDCRGGFDFTLAFEESILTIAPSAIFLLLAVPRSVYLLKTPDKAKRRSTYTAKLVTSAVYAVLQIVLLALVPTTNLLNTRFSIASAVLNFLAALSIVLLTPFEHVKSIRPSFLLTAYLFTSLLLDAARLRTEWLISLNTAYAGVLSASTVLKLALLSLETVEKRRILIRSDWQPSKESTSGPFSRGFFVWLNSLLFKGWATVLTNSTLPAIYEKLSSEKLAVRFGAGWDKATRGGKRPSLFSTTLNILKWDLLGIALPRIALIGLSISQPFLVSHVLRFLAMPEDQATMNLGYGLIGAYAFVFFGSAILTAWYEHLTFRAGAMVRGGLITLIYRKMMRLPTNDLGESSAVTLMGNDVETLAERLHQVLVESWANTLTVGIAIYLLAIQLGPVCVAPIIMAIVSIILSGSTGKFTVPRQKVYQEATQDRLNFTSEVLGSMKSVKMLGFTERFTDIIAKKRDDELSVGKRFRTINVYTNCIINCNHTLTEAVTFGAYAISATLSGNNSFSASQGITVLSILSVMMSPLGILLGTIPQSFSAFGCFKRIQDFLYLDERVDPREIESFSGKGHPETRTTAPVETGEGLEMNTLQSADTDGTHMAIVGGTFNWEQKAVLQDITISVPRSPQGSLTMVIGPIGAGKSTLLKGILGETTSSDGIISLRSPDIACCEQTPWVMNATIRANIIAESKGFESSWFDTVIDACDLAVDLAQFPERDLTVVGDKGVKMSGGQKQRLAIARAVYSRKPMAVFDDVFSGLDKVTERTVFNRVFGKGGLLRKNGTTVILATHAIHLLPNSDHIIALGADGKIAEQGNFTDLHLSGSYVRSLDVSSHHHDDQAHGSVVDHKLDNGLHQPGRSEQTSDEEEVLSDRATFKYYFQAIRGYNLGIQTFTVALQGAISMIRYVWLTWWGNGKGHSSNDLGYWLSIYAVLSLLEGLSVTVCIAHFQLILGPTSGRILHKRILKAAMNAPMSFLSNTATGSLVNRFSQDLRLVDMTLPIALSVFLFEMASCVGAAGLAIAAVSWFGLTIPFIIGVLVLIQRFYVRTSKQLRLLEIEHKAPLFSHFFESINGLATIRAFGWVRPYTDKNLRLLDEAQRPSYLLFCIQRWLTLVLDCVVSALTVLLVVFAVCLRDKLSSSILGVALVNMMQLGRNMKGIIVYWSVLETSLGAVTRIRNFAEMTPQEQQAEENQTPDAGWLSNGAMEIKDLAVQYSASSEPVLRGVSFDIQSGDKVGLCGRSGSGKSSLIQALLRMADIVEGQMIVDGQDITKVPRSLLRQKMTCLTQDPFLFTDSVRFNADPLGKRSDEAIVEALERVGLWDVVKAKVEEGKEPLDARMDENFLSHGQRQLFCLGRALLNKTSVLILDEPTSSVDSLTDAKIQEVIRSEFQGCTIIMIAHRLDTLLDFDKVVVLDSGSLVEVGRPTELLADDSSAFARLYRGGHGQETRQDS